MPRLITLTAEQEARFRELWTSGVAVSRIANELQFTHDTINRIRSRLKLKPRTPQSRAAPTKADRDPTPEEIRERIAVIQAGWSADTELRRRAIPQSGHVEAVFYPDDAFELDE